MTNYFTGIERMDLFEKTGTPMRMAAIPELQVPDYQVVRQLVKNQEWEKATHYVTTFHAQNKFMNSVYFEWAIIIVDYYKELTSLENYKKNWPVILKDFRIILDTITALYPTPSEKEAVDKMFGLFNKENLTIESVDLLFQEMDKDFHELMATFSAKDQTRAQEMINRFHHHVVVRHDSLAGFVYSVPSTVVTTDNEKIAVELSNGSVLRNQKWLGLWELSKVLAPVDLAAFLAEHLRFHMSGTNREGQTHIIEDDKKVRLIFDPCGSGGAIRRRLGDKVVNLQEKHQLAWSKCGEVNLYCTHCALNEKYSIDHFGYPKLVVEFNPDADKPCGWTIYKNKEDVPAAVYKRLGLKP